MYEDFIVLFIFIICDSLSNYWIQHSITYSHISSERRKQNSVEMDLMITECQLKHVVQKVTPVKCCNNAINTDAVCVINSGIEELKYQILKRLRWSKLWTAISKTLFTSKYTMYVHPLVLTECTKYKVSRTNQLGTVFVNHTEKYEVSVLF
jgi:hypothetical protein